MKTRMRFVKCGSMKFIGHLDCMRFFQKAIRRAKLDVAYSKGYSPHLMKYLLQTLKLCRMVLKIRCRFLSLRIIW